MVVVSWHQESGEETPRTEQMELTALDVTRLRDFCSAWLSLEPEPEPREAA